MIWNEKIECMDPEDLKNIQSERLKDITDYVYQRSPVYKNKLDASGVKPSDIKGIGDIKKLPFTVKEDLRDNYPFGLFSVGSDELAEIHVSSGTTGNPIVVGYTKDDLKLWSEVMARTLCCAGAMPRDKFQIAVGYGLFTGGLGFHYGALEMGLGIIPTSSGQTRRQLKVMTDFKPRLLICTPSYSLYMAEVAREIGLDPKDSSWETGICGAEPWSEEMRKQIESTWNMRVHDDYGLSEIIGPGVAQECLEQKGLHLFSDVFYPEIVDPGTGEHVREGNKGELVITTLTKKGLPLLRYRTRDICSISYEKCACGRTSPRISKVFGRTDDMIKVRGISVFPSQIEEVLLGIKGTLPNYQLIIDRKLNDLDELEIMVEADQKIFSGGIKELRIFEDKVKEEIDSALGVFVKVKLVEPRTIERSEGKAKRVIDKRVL